MNVNTSLKNPSGSAALSLSHIDLGSAKTAARESIFDTPELKSIFAPRLISGDYSFVDQMCLLDLINPSIFNPGPASEKLDVRLAASRFWRGGDVFNFDSLISVMSELPIIQDGACLINPACDSASFLKINNVFEPENYLDNLQVLQFGAIPNQAASSAWEGIYHPYLLNIRTALKGLYQYVDSASAIAELSTNLNFQALKIFLEESKSRFQSRVASEQLDLAIIQIDPKLIETRSAEEVPFSFKDFCLDLDCIKILEFKEIVRSLCFSDLCDRYEFSALAVEDSKIPTGQGFWSSYVDGWGQDLSSPVIDSSRVSAEFDSLLNNSVCISDAQTRKTLEISCRLMKQFLSEVYDSDYEELKDQNILYDFLAGNSAGHRAAENTELKLNKKQKTFSLALIGLFVIREKGLFEANSEFTKSDKAFKAAQNLAIFSADLLKRRENRLQTERDMLLDSDLVHEFKL